MRRILFLALLPFAQAIPAQVYLVASAGASAISNGASATSQPPSAANYDAKVGPALNVAGGFHFTDWFSAQAGFHWNRNRVITTSVAGSDFRQTEAIQGQRSLSGELLVYFRPRSSAIRPYLSGGPAWIGVASRNQLGFRTAVGADLRIRKGWAFRYSFSEMLSGNPLASALRPPAKGRLMNFQNLFGVVKTF